MNGPPEGELVRLAANWIRENNLGTNGSELQMTADTDLLSSGLLDSLLLVGLILFIEEAAGSKIDLLEIDPSEFATLGGLCRCAVEANKKETGRV